jgi:hypothetical protein
MTPAEKAFLEADFNWVSTLQSIWKDQPSQLDSAPDPAADRIMREFAALWRSETPEVIGQVITGPAGSGKTHLMGTLRRRVWQEVGWFVFIDIVGVTDFWRTAVFGFVRSLRQTMPDGQSQYMAVFFAALKQMPEATKREVMQGAEGSGAIRTVNAFVRALQQTFPEAMEHSNVIRALLLQNDPDAAEIAYSWLQGLEIDPDDRRRLGLTGGTLANEPQRPCHDCHRPDRFDRDGRKHSGRKFSRLRRGNGGARPRHHRDSRRWADGSA